MSFLHEVILFSVHTVRLLMVVLATTFDFRKEEYSPCSVPPNESEDKLSHDFHNLQDRSC